MKQLTRPRGIISVRRLLSCLSVCFAVLLLISSCTKAPESNYLRYQDFPFALTARLRLDDAEAEVSLTLHASDTMTVTFSAPETLSGITLNTALGSVTASCCGTELALPDAAAEYGVLRLLCLFSLENAWLTGVKITEQSGVTVNEVSFAMPESGGAVTVTLDGKTGYPCRFTWNAEGHRAEIDVLSFTPLTDGKDG